MTKVHVDVVTLAKLAKELRKDAQILHALHPSSMRSCAEIIETAIGAPIWQRTRDYGVKRADELYKGSPSQRLAFNEGVRFVLMQIASIEEKDVLEDELDACG